MKDFIILLPKIRSRIYIYRLRLRNHVLDIGISIQIGRCSLAGNQGRINRLCHTFGGAPLEVIENLQEMEDEGDIYESIEDIWPDYPSKEDFFFNEEEY